MTKESKLLRLFRKEKKEPVVEALLKRIPIFEDLSKRELMAVERILHQRDYVPEEIIFREDEPGLGMYMIESGRVSILSESAKLKIAEFSDGAFFGEISLLDDAPRSASAVATTSCRIYGLFRPDLFSLIERDPKLGLKIILHLASLIAQRLRDTNKRAFAFNEQLQQMKTGPQL
jgi:CRP/FNR family transcriptional regulator, cyclic AMP receptor protein